MSDTPDNLPTISEVSPLKAMLIELHEVYEELVSIGFSEKAATQIVAHMVSDAILYRSGYDYDVEIEDDMDEDDEDLTDD